MLTYLSQRLQYKEISVLTSKNVVQFFLEFTYRFVDQMAHSLMEYL